MQQAHTESIAHGYLRSPSRPRNLLKDCILQMWESAEGLRDQALATLVVPGANEDEQSSQEGSGRHRRVPSTDDSTAATGSDFRSGSFSDADPELGLAMTPVSSRQPSTSRSMSWSWDSVTGTPRGSPLHSRPNSDLGGREATAGIFYPASSESGHVVAHAVRGRDVPPGPAVQARVVSNDGAFSFNPSSGVAEAVPVAVQRSSDRMNTRHPEALVLEDAPALSSSYGRISAYRGPPRAPDVDTMPVPLLGRGLISTPYLGSAPESGGDHRYYPHQAFCPTQRTPWPPP